MMDNRKSGQGVEDGSLRALQIPLAPVQDLDAGDLCGHGRGIAGCLQLQGNQGNLEVKYELGFVSVSAGEEIVLGSAM